ncbi:MAG: triose-phosphate isomerase [Oscillospiraceae bacterium]|jgi:triosephosphate isomerase|nr:triose-phosphate isomerase [Oscillospiraceae bacterium]
MNKKYRKTIIAGNWKMNLVPSEVKAFADELRAFLPKARTCEVALLVPYTHISTLRRALKDNRIGFGAQDVSARDKGAYTGEVSADMLSDMNAHYVIVGHSECRQYHGDTDFTVGEKAAAVLGKGMCPIICVGESLEQRERGLTMAYTTYQVLAALSYIPEGKERQIVIAYEPIWAIGTGRTASPEEAGEVCAGIRAVLRAKRGARAARSVSILYGGSMNPGNAKTLLSMPDIDGGLIGGASLKPRDFSQIVDAVALAAQEA